MANIESAKKRVRQAVVRTERNISRKNRIRTMLRRVEEAISSGDKEIATSCARVAQKELMKGVTKGIFHLKTASRKVSRLSLRINALGK